MKLFNEAAADRIVSLSRQLRKECQEMRETTDSMNARFDEAVNALQDGLRELHKSQQRVLFTEEHHGQHDPSMAS